MAVFRGELRNGLAKLCAQKCFMMVLWYEDLVPVSRQSLWNRYIAFLFFLPVYSVVFFLSGGLPSFWLGLK
jgi:hypothetical protein